MRSRPARPLTQVAASVLVGLTLLIGLTLRVAAAAAPPAGGPPPGPPPPPKNLQYFRKDIPRQELIGEMRQFCFALGVRCDHCHVDEEGPNGREDFASDEKPAKLKARAMLLMTKQINGELLAKIPGRLTPAVNVSCVTCHHGLPHPETLADRLGLAATAGGVDSAVAELKDLREGAEFGRYDVSEWGVNEAARVMSASGKRKEALAVLTANAGYHPESFAIPSMMAEIHVAMGDTLSAVKILKKLVVDDPGNRRAKMMLDRLTGVAPTGGGH